MSLFGKIFNKLNPTHLIGKVFGGTFGSIVNIAKTMVVGLATGRKFGDILKDVLRDVATLALKAAVTYFTGGTAALFVDKLVGFAQGALGKVVGELARSALGDGVKTWVGDKLGGLARSFAGDAFKDLLTRTVTGALGLPGADAPLDTRGITDAVLDKVVGAFQGHAETVIAPEDRAATLYTIDPQTCRDRSHELSAYEDRPAYDKVIGRQGSAAPLAPPRPARPRGLPGGRACTWIAGGVSFHRAAVSSVFP